MGQEIVGACDTCKLGGDRHVQLVHDLDDERTTGAQDQCGCAPEEYTPPIICIRTPGHTGPCMGFEHGRDVDEEGRTRRPHEALMFTCRVDDGVPHQ